MLCRDKNSRIATRNAVLLTSVWLWITKGTDMVAVLVGVGAGLGARVGTPVGAGISAGDGIPVGGVGAGGPRATKRHISLGDLSADAFSSSFKSSPPYKYTAPEARESAQTIAPFRPPGEVGLCAGENIMAKKSKTCVGNKMQHRT